MSSITQIFVFPFIREDGEPAAVAQLCTASLEQVHAVLRQIGSIPKNPAGTDRLPWIWKFFESLEAQGGVIEEPACCHIEPDATS